MCLLAFLYIALLFFALVPGIFLSLPAKGTKFVVAGVHAVVFGIIFHFTHRIVNRMGVSLEGFTEVPDVTNAPMMSDSESSSDDTDKKTKTTEPTSTMGPTVPAETMFATSSQ